MFKCGGVLGGVEFEDFKTFFEFGFDKDMSVWEYFWVDSVV